PHTSRARARVASPRNSPEANTCVGAMSSRPARWATSRRRSTEGYAERIAGAAACRRAVIAASGSAAFSASDGLRGSDSVAGTWVDRCQRDGEPTLADHTTPPGRGPAVALARAAFTISPTHSCSSKATIAGDPELPL